MIYSCFDIGGTAIKFCLIDETGRFHKKGSLPTEAQTEGGPGIVHKVCSLIQRQLTDHPLEGIGLSTAGNVILFILIALIILPFTYWFNRREVEI